MVRALILVLALVSVTGPVDAQDASASRIDERPALAREITDLFSAFCIDAFPDDAALDAAMKERGATTMTKEEVAALLHKDPGRGWRMKGAEGEYTVTEEAPPYHSCAIRVTTPKPFPPLPFFELRKAYAATTGRTMAKPLLTVVPAGGILTTQIFTDMVSSDVAAPKEALIFLLSMPLGVKDPTAETRLVHQITPR